MMEENWNILYSKVQIINILFKLNILKNILNIERKKSLKISNLYYSYNIIDPKI